MTGLVAGGVGTVAGRSSLDALTQTAADDGGNLAVERLSERLTVVTDAGRKRTPNSSTRTCCLLDGSVFNSAEIAAEIGLPPHAAQEAVLAAAFDRHGESMLAQLRGNFTLLVNEAHSNRVLLACDQLGSRSLFFKSDGSGFFFATEIRDLLRLLPTRPSPDEAALVHWLAKTSMPEGRTLYRGIERLGGGRLIEFSEERVAVRRYWSPTYAPQTNLSRADGAEAARAMLAGAVARQVPGDAHCGVLLSGGLDSSSVAALARRTTTDPGSIHAYSAVFPEHSSIDESSLIEEAVTDLGLDRTILAIRGGSMLQGSLEYLESWEVPLPAPNHFLWQPLLERAAENGTEFMLDGEGGDELWKFSPYLLADFCKSGRIGLAAHTAREMLGTELYRGWRSGARYLRAYGLKGAIPGRAHRTFRRCHSPKRYAPGWLTNDSARTLFEHQDPWAWKQLDGPRWWAYMADLLTGVRERLGVGEYLRHRAQMAGLRARHPLIDLDLVEFALSLPPTLAIDPDLERPLLREAIEGLVPDSIRLRPSKSYFTALFHDSLAEPDAALIRRLLTEDPHVGDYVDLEAVRRDVLDDPPSGRHRDRSWPWSAWRLVTAECWLRAQHDDGFATRLLEDCESPRGDWTLSSIPR